MLEAVLCELEGVLADRAPLRDEALRASLASAGAMREASLHRRPPPTGPGCRTGIL
jgi:hypothetical protein